MALIIIDFDNTITSKHTYHIIQQAISKQQHLQTDQAAQWELVNNIPAIQYVDGDKTLTWAELLVKMDAEGHQIGIASFNRYGPNIIPRYLKYVIGLNDALIAKIAVDSWLPSEVEQNSKNKHIFTIKNKLEYRNLMATIVLVDDDQQEEILPSAIERGFSTLKAYDDGRHLKYLNDSVLPMLKPDSDRFIEFKNNQRNWPHGIDFSGDVVEIDFGIMQIEESAEKSANDAHKASDQSYDVQFISSSMSVKKVAENLSHGLIITSDGKLFCVAEKVLAQFVVEPDAILSWLNESRYVEVMQRVLDQPLSIFERLCNDSKTYQALMVFCCNSLIPFKAADNSVLPSVYNARDVLFNSNNTDTTQRLGGNHHKQNSLAM